jgi:multidrug efflux system membrane fusion protein
MKSKSSYLLAGAIAAVVVGWMISDDIMASLQKANPIEEKSSSEIASQNHSSAGVPDKQATKKSEFSAIAVQVKNNFIVRKIRASGVSSGKFEIVISSKSAGEVEDLLAREGENISAGDVLLRLDRGTLSEQITAARANLEVVRKQRDITEPYQQQMLSKQITAARASLDFAVIQRDVTEPYQQENLAKQILAAKADLDVARTRRDVTEPYDQEMLVIQIQAARENLELAKKRLAITMKLADEKYSAPLEKAEQQTAVAEANNRLKQLEIELERRQKVASKERQTIVEASEARLRQLEIELSNRQKVAKQEHEKAVSEAKSKLSNLENELANRQNVAKEEREAAVANAMVNLTQLEEQLQDKTVSSPVSGYLQTLHVEKGERVRQDMPLATVIGLDVLTVSLAVPQTKVSQLKLGNKVEINFGNQEFRTGVIAKISAKANPSTRTFNVEVDVANPDQKLRSGMTVEAEIEAGSVTAFEISPAHLSVDDKGGLSAKTVVAGKVVVVPVEVIQSGVGKVFVSGLDDGDILLTVGQAFVNSGETVKYQLVSHNEQHN